MDSTGDFFDNETHNETTQQEGTVEPNPDEGVEIGRRYIKRSREKADRELFDSDAKRTGAYRDDETTRRIAVEESAEGKLLEFCRSIAMQLVSKVALDPKAACVKHLRKICQHFPKIQLDTERRDG
jgi:hypothetical protein